MDQTLKRICGLLCSADKMKRCAAAITLAALAPKDAGVVKALGESLEDAGGELTAYLLAALDAIGSPAAVPYVMPLLDAEEVETKLRAVSIISRAGGSVVPRIKERLDVAPRRMKPVLVDLLARIHRRDSFQAVLQLLVDPDTELGREACEAVRRHIAGAGAKERTALHGYVKVFMASPPVGSRERALCSCLLLLGVIGRPEARGILLKHAVPKMPLAVRRSALAGLRDLELTRAGAAGVMKQVLPYLKESEDDIVRQALDVLERLQPSGDSATTWDKLLGNPHASVRAFAARKLADLDNAASNRRLIALLRDKEGELGEVAARALAGHKGAKGLLVEAFAKEQDVDVTWRLARVLGPHSERTDKRTVERFSALALRELMAGNLRHKPLLYFLRRVSPGAADEVLREAGLKHKRAKRWAEAVECLRRLVGTALFDDGTRYALSLCNLRVSPKELASQVRAEDHALRGFHGLIRNRGFGLLARLKKEKALDAADLYYVGFHFSEVPGVDEEFGQQVLQHVAKTWPRSKEGKAARSKLRLSAPTKKARSAKAK